MDAPEELSIRTKEKTMRKCMLSILILLLVHTAPAARGAESFLGAPVAPEGEIGLRQENRLEFMSPHPHDQVLAFYKDAFKDEKDIRFRNWKDVTYIEDDGARSWHSITISKEYKNGTEIVIMKDSWTWIIGTLILRYIGVFIVLVLLLIGMAFSGAVISRWFKPPETQKGSAP
jgi:hypothetical protein